MEQTLIERVEEAMSTDDEDREEQSEILLKTYEEATPAEKAKSDSLARSGWHNRSTYNGRCIELK